MRQQSSSTLHGLDRSAPALKSFTSLAPGSSALKDGMSQLSGRLGLAKATAEACGFRELTILWHTEDGELVPVGAHQPSVTLVPSSEFEIARQLWIAHLDNPSDQTAAAKLDDHNHLAVMALQCSGQMFSISGVPNAEMDVTGCRRKLEYCLPILRACLRMWLLSNKAVVLASNLRAALDGCDIPVAIVDRELTLSFANQKCREFFSNQNRIFLTGSRLSCAKLPDTLNLQASIAYITDNRSDRVYDPILAIEQRHKRPLIVAIARATAEPSRQVAAPSALLYFFDPDIDLKAAIEPVCAIYHLTHQECELTFALANGFSLREASKSLGIKEQTARSYLKQIFAKTETNRQPDLIKLLITSAVRTLSMKPKRLVG